MGAILQQQGHSIAHISKAFGPRSRALSVYDKELLAITFGVGKWIHYLEQGQFFIKTDHESIKYLLKQRFHTNLQQKGISKLFGFDYKILYWKGIENKVIDALSRKPEDEYSRHYCTVTHSVALPVWTQNVVTELSWRWEGVHATNMKLIRYFFWNGMLQDVMKWVRKCETCARCKAEYCVYPRFTKSACLYLWVATIAQLFLDNVFKLHGVPQITVSGRDRIFTSNFCQELFKKMGVNLAFSSVYHPQSDGQNERVNQRLEGYLSAIKMSPFEAFYGYVPPLFPSGFAEESSAKLGDSVTPVRELPQYHEDKLVVAPEEALQTRRYLNLIGIDERKWPKPKVLELRQNSLEDQLKFCGHNGQEERNAKVPATVTESHVICANRSRGESINKEEKNEESI
ncbi:uncharacterized protein LOC131178812 [Hevea brasiliensis]|uniref:uncharacterized protein LOC131178812 n=1 Tax=Hevea brasiliensis TaxID=3981 RepID=UPI0025F8C58C|nr:uncharacterized protein LOC131178812 [Hevea brasiliensis]